LLIGIDDLLPQGISAVEVDEVRSLLGLGKSDGNGSGCVGAVWAVTQTVEPRRRWRKAGQIKLQRQIVLRQNDRQIDRQPLTPAVEHRLRPGGLRKLRAGHETPGTGLPDPARLFQ
jgi:hypothetical protein